jgi:tRNA1Val (adenine37-N6)-methyltransferase
MAMGFRFRQFTVDDSRSVMKVGTDAVLLGAWAGREAADAILDIGCGSGLIALMMAQRFEDARITAIDIHAPSVEQAAGNFIASAWSGRLQAVQSSLQDYARQHKKAFDLIVSNPPFFSNSLRPPDQEKGIARHTASLSHRELAFCAAALLQDNGRFALILPAGSQSAFEDHARAAGLVKCRQSDIVPVAGKAVNRVMSEWGSRPETTEQSRLTIRSAGGDYTEEYKKLTAAFYLAL